MYICKFYHLACFYALELEIYLQIKSKYNVKLLLDVYLKSVIWYVFYALELEIYL